MNLVCVDRFRNWTATIDCTKRRQGASQAPEKTMTGYILPNQKYIPEQRVQLRQLSLFTIFVKSSKYTISQLLASSSCQFLCCFFNRLSSSLFSSSTFAVAVPLRHHLHAPLPLQISRSKLVSSTSFGCFLGQAKQTKLLPALVSLFLPHCLSLVLFFFNSLAHSLALGPNINLWLSRLRP